MVGVGKDGRCRVLSRDWGAGGNWVDRRYGMMEEEEFNCEELLWGKRRTSGSVEAWQQKMEKEGRVRLKNKLGR